MSRHVSGRMRLIVSVLLTCGCVNFGYRQVIEIDQGDSVEAKLETAKEYATEERLAELKEQVKARLPGTTDQQRWWIVCRSKAGPFGWKDSRELRISCRCQADCIEARKVNGRTCES